MVIHGYTYYLQQKNIKPASVQLIGIEIESSIKHLNQMQQTLLPKKQALMGRALLQLKGVEKNGSQNHL